MFTALSLSGCVTLTDIETSQEHTPDVIGVVSAGQTVGQTFISRRSGLNGLTVWLSQANETAAEARVLGIALYLDEDRSRPVFSTEVYIASETSVTVALPARPDPPRQAYYMELSMRGGQAGVLGRSEDAYPFGAAYLGAHLGPSPRAGDIAFRTTYKYGLPAVIEDARGMLSSAWLLLPLGALLALPGWLLLDLTGLGKRFDPGEQAGLSVGLSLALAPTLILWTSLFGLRWSRPAVVVGVTLLSLLALARLLRRLRAKNVQSGEDEHLETDSPKIVPRMRAFDWPALALGAIFLLALGLRLAMVRDLSAPAWVDSVHHALITRLIMEQGLLPASYAPYTAIDSTQYHLGFHTGLAAFQWLSGLAAPEALLFYGQALNALAAVAVYLLTTTLTRSRPAGLFAALITAFVTPMPAYYTSWGRYTQLAGLLILPAVLALVRLVVEERHGRLAQPLALAGLLMAGLAMVHYRVAAFAACLLAAYVLSQLSWSMEGLQRLARRAGLSAASVGGGAFLLTLPWIVPTLTRHILPALEPSQAAVVKPFADFSWRYLTAALGTYSLGLAAAGLAFGLLNRRRFPAALLLWTALLFLLANLGALGLPGGALVNNTSVAISLFMPISAAGGYALSTLYSGWSRVMPGRWLVAYRAALIGGAVVLAAFGARHLMTVLNPVTELFRSPDRPAIEWMADNLPPGETVLINPFNWGYGVYAGNDGGYWIAPLTGSRTFPEPVLSGLGDFGEVRKAASLAQAVIQHGANPPELWELMQANDMRYIYAGVRGGPISPAALQESPLFRVLYHHNGAWVFEALAP